MVAVKAIHGGSTLLQMISSVLILLVGGVLLGHLASRLFQVLTILPASIVGVGGREEGRWSQVAQLIKEDIPLFAAVVVMIIACFALLFVPTWMIAFGISLYPIANILISSESTKEAIPLFAAAVVTIIAFFAFVPTLW